MSGKTERSVKTKKSINKKLKLRKAFYNKNRC